MAKKRVLVIDDEEKITRLLSLRLQAGGYEVDTAENGAVGLEKIKKQKPDLIILDVMMPVMDGFEFFKTIKKDPEGSKIPLLVLTARGAMKDTFEAFDADAFVPKPFDSENLVSQVNFLLKNKALVLSSDNYATEKIVSALKKYDYEATVVGNEDSLMEKGKNVKYPVIVIHLALCAKEPKDFVPMTRMMKLRDPKIILYCDANVKGTEDNYTVAIDEIRKKWKIDVGIETFFDARTARGTFSEVLKDWLA